jgi:hypothetical protein
MDITSKIEDIKNFGIDLKLDSRDAEVFYMMALKSYFDSLDEFYTIPTTELEIKIFDNEESLASLVIEGSILRIVPISENPYSILMPVLDFVAAHHNKTVALFNELEAGGDELAIQILKEFEQVDAKGLQNSEESDEDSDDDFEWI